MAPPMQPDPPCKGCGQPAERYRSPRGWWIRPRFCRACRERFRHPAGEDHWHWRGGERASKDGYLRVYVARGKRTLEHRAVWEAAHGPIPRGLHIHHKNGDKTDNRLENLEILTNKEHQAKHRDTPKPWSKNHAACLDCGTTQRRHQARGLCNACYLRWWYQR